MGGGIQTGLREPGSIWTCQGVWWVRVWCLRQSRTRLSSAGGSAVGPVDDVVGVAGDREAGAAGEGAVSVAEHEAFQMPVVTRRSAAADVEDLAFGAEDGGDDLGVTREPSDGGDGEPVPGGELPAVVEVAVALVEELLESGWSR